MSSDETLDTAGHPDDPSRAGLTTPGPGRTSAEGLEKPGDDVGPYRLISQLGEGGFGTVWLAERRHPFVQRVALKVVKAGMDSRSVVARFEQERQALAMMNHPGIAKVLDGGLTRTGRPYFAMEFVKGEPITGFCDGARMGIEDRLQLFGQVCEAVQHAHTKGIIHRDLKPSNVLVTRGEGDRPIAKVIDFGIAKALTQQLTDKTVFTETGQMIGTPEYMSPEQAEPDATDIDTRSDVYSLGVILYELLVGSPPFESGDLRRRTYRDIQRVIREVDPPSPSARLTTVATRDAERASSIGRSRGAEFAAISKQLRGELEWIPMKAIRKSRDERYMSPLELAADVRRYLAGQKLSAGPDAFGYVFGKWALRHEKWFSALILAVSCLGVGAAIAVAISGFTLGSSGIGDPEEEGFAIVLGFALMAGSQAVLLTGALLGGASWVVPPVRGERLTRRLAPCVAASVGAVLLGATLAWVLLAAGILPIEGIWVGTPAAVVAFMVLAPLSLVVLARASILRGIGATAVAIALAIPFGGISALLSGCLVPAVVAATRNAARAAAPTAVRTYRTGEPAAAWSEQERQLQRTFDVLVREPDPAVVTDAAARERMRATGLPWKIRHAGSGVVLLLVPPGEFRMGSEPAETGREDDEARHPRTVGRPFYLGESELSRGEWRRLYPSVDARSVLQPTSEDGSAIDRVSWLTAQSLVGASNGLFRLPSEAEWEYACRAGTDTAYWFGSNPDAGAFVHHDGSAGASAQSNKVRSPRTAGDQPANPWGFRGMHGNVLEWCDDLYAAYPASGGQDPATGLAGPRVMRGGAYETAAAACRSAAREFAGPEDFEGAFGIRLVHEPVPPGARPAAPTAASGSPAPRSPG